MSKKNPGLLKVLTEYFGTYLPDVKGVSHNTIFSYQYAFQLLFEFVYETTGLAPEKVTFESLSSGMVARYLNWLETGRGCSAQTRNQRRAAIASFAKYAIKKPFAESLAFHSEVSEIPKKKEPKVKGIKYFSKEEISILLSIPDTKSRVGWRDTVLMSVLYASGTRAQEICDLTVNDVAFGKTTTLRLMGKGRKARTIVLPEKCASLLKCYLDKKCIAISSLEALRKHVFSSQTHEKMTVSCVEEIVKKHVAKARKDHPLKFRQPRYSPHCFRHSIAVHMLECGESLAVIRAFLGHASISSTMVYASVTPELANKYLRERDISLGQIQSAESGYERFASLAFLQRSKRQTR